jgi:hypothetical protein
MHIDDTHYPIVLTTIDLNPTAQEIEAFFARSRGIADRAIREGSYYVSIMVAAGAFSPLQRAKLAEEVKKTSDEQVRRSLNTFLVVESAVMRGALMAMKWIAAEKIGTVTPVASWGEGLELAITTLRDKGIRLPPSVARLRMRRVG